MLATCYFVPRIYLVPDNFTCYIHMAVINASKKMYYIFFLISILWISNFNVRLSGTKYIHGTK